MTARRGQAAIPPVIAAAIARIQAEPAPPPDPEAERVQVRAEVRAHQAQLRLDAWRAGLSAEHQVPQPLDANVESWAGQLGRGLRPGALVIHGAVMGCGKTQQAVDAVVAAWEAGFDGAAELVTPATWREATEPPGDRAALQRWRRVPLLILDDLGAHRMGEHALSHLYDVADARWGRRLPTILTTNVDDLAGMLRDRISSRFAARVTVAELEDTDYRRVNP